MDALIAPFPPRGKLDAVVELQDDEEVVAEGEDPWEEEGVQEAEIGVSRLTHTSAVADGFSHRNPSPLIPEGLCVASSAIEDCRRSRLRLLLPGSFDVSQGAQVSTVIVFPHCNRSGEGGGGSGSRGRSTATEVVIEVAK